MDRDVISNRWIRQDLQSSIFDREKKKKRNTRVISSNPSSIGSIDFAQSINLSRFNERVEIIHGWFLLISH